MFRMSTVCPLVVSLIAWLAGVANAQEPSAKPWRLSYTDNTTNGDGRTKVEFYDTRQEAEAAKRLCVLANDGSRGLDPKARLPYTNIKIDQVAAADRQSHLADSVKEAKEAVDKAKEIKEKGLAALAKGHKLGDTLRDYGKALAKSLSQVKKLRSTLLSMTGTIERRTFDQINRQIDDFNKQAEDYNERVTSAQTVLRLQRENGGRIIGPGEFSTIETLDLVQPDELKGTLSDTDEQDWVDLAGKRAGGTLGRVNGGTGFWVEFRQGGVAVMGTAEEGKSFTGTWKQTGKAVTMKAGASVFTGSIRGREITGTRSRRSAKTLVDTDDRWSLVVGEGSDVQRQNHARKP